MDRELRWIADVVGARDVERADRIQELWGGYGELVRVHLIGGSSETAIVKWAKAPIRARGSAPDVSRDRKCRSYEVETAWYRRLAPFCDETTRVPALLGSRIGRGEWILVLEDLDAAGFPERRHRVGHDEIDRCLAWLASFHARFLGVAPDGLWKSGTYWHLATRLDELAAMSDAALRSAAPLLDRMLSTCTHRTLVHGDAKVANFCFSSTKPSVAAVDFQYVGGGCGMKDVAYFLASCSRRGAEAADERYLDLYFRHLGSALGRRTGPRVDQDALECEWRALYPIAHADFCRFMAGWAPDEWRRDAHGQSMVARVLGSLSERSGALRS